MNDTNITIISTLSKCRDMTDAASQCQTFVRDGTFTSNVRDNSQSKYVNLDK